MSDIPTDAFREVLRRVPVESLFQLRSVCKAWCHIIDDPEFSKLQITSGIGDNWIIHRNKNGKFFLLPMKHLFFRKNLMVDCGCDKTRMKSCKRCCTELVNATNIKPLVCPEVPCISRLPAPCCNGLILISSRNKNSVWVIWNPFTGDSFKLPPCDEFPSDGGSGDLYSGLGYDEASDDYKVVRIFESGTFICSVNSRAWRRIEDFPSDCIRLHARDESYLCTDTEFMCNGAFANGALHWVAYTANPQGYGCLVRVVALDLTTETYRKVPLPLGLRCVSNPSAIKLAALSGRLFLTSWDQQDLYAVWMIKDYNGCANKMWTKMTPLEHVDCFYMGGFSPIAYLEKENRVLFRNKSQMFSWYDMKKKYIRTVCMEVDPNANGADQVLTEIKHAFGEEHDIFTTQVIPASLVRLQKNDGANGVVAPEAKSSNRKRKRGDHETLGLKIIFGFPSPHDWMNGNY